MVLVCLQFCLCLTDTNCALLHLLNTGDELAKTHDGNNNWYGHNKEWTFVNWDLKDSQQNLLRFCSELIKFRKGHPALARAEFVG